MGHERIVLTHNSVQVLIDTLYKSKHWDKAVTYCYVERVLLLQPKQLILHIVEECLLLLNHCICLFASSAHSKTLWMFGSDCVRIQVTLRSMCVLSTSSLFLDQSTARIDAWLTPVHRWLLIILRGRNFWTSQQILIALPAIHSCCLHFFLLWPICHLTNDQCPNLRWPIVQYNVMHHISALTQTNSLNNIIVFNNL